MQSTTFTNLQAKYRRVTRPSWPSQQNAGGFFDVHPVGSLLPIVFALGLPRLHYLHRLLLCRSRQIAD
jgi:hypothetical protein